MRRSGMWWELVVLRCGQSRLGLRRRLYPAACAEEGSCGVVVRWQEGGGGRALHAVGELMIAWIFGARQV